MANEKLDWGIAIGIATALIAFGEKIVVFIRWFITGKKKEDVENSKTKAEADILIQGGMANERDYWKKLAMEERTAKEQALAERDTLKKELGEFEKKFQQLQIEFTLLTIKANSLT